MLIQKLAWGFAVLFFLVVIVTNIPMFNDTEGRNFGLFKIDPIDNVVHLLTAVWGALAAWYSARASKWFFIFFGLLYGFDAVAGLFFERGVLDMSIFTEPGGAPNLSITNWLINLPHIVIAAPMIWIGLRKPPQAQISSLQFHS